MNQPESQNDAPLIELRNLTFRRGARAVLDNLSLSIPRGKVTAILGSSGTGKTTLLNLIGGRLRPEAGEVMVDGLSVPRLSTKALYDLRKRMGLLFQSGALLTDLNVFENVAFPLKEKTRLDDKLISERVLNELEHVGLSGSEYKYPSQISGGMVKRAALARALVMDPEIMLFDEPTTGLDPVIGAAILNVIDSCHKRLSFTGIIVTHEIPKVFDIVDRVAMLHEGVIWAEGTPEELTSSGEPIVHAFVGESVNTSISSHSIRSADQG